MKVIIWIRLKHGYLIAEIKNKFHRITSIFSFHREINSCIKTQKLKNEVKERTGVERYL